MPTILRRILIVLAILLGIGWAGSVARAELEINLTLDSVRAFAEGLGPFGPFLFVLVVAGRTLLWLPSQVVLVAAGLCFGTVVGALVGGTGLMISGLFLFSAARYAGRDAIEGYVGERGRHLLSVANRKTGAVAFGLACGYPVTPLAPIQAAAGLTRMTYPHFILSALIGGSIRASLFAYFGDALIDASWKSLALPTGAFILVAGLPLLFPPGRAWLRDLFVPPPKEKKPDSRRSPAR